MVVYRLCDRRFPLHDGQGAALYGGRWNLKGTPLVYTASNLALCALEILAGATTLGANYISFEIEIPKGLAIDEVRIEDLPASWQDPRHPVETRRIGTDWDARMSSCVLRVPSAVIPQDFNYLLNPLHPDFERLTIGPAVRFQFDARLVARYASDSTTN